MHRDEHTTKYAVVIAGVPLPASSVATLARCLQETGHVLLASDLGSALDAGRVEMRLTPHEDQAILSGLDACPEELKPLRDTLRASIEGDI